MALVENCEAEIENSQFKGGRAKEGGAISIYKDSSLVLTNCSFSHNQASQGGDVFGSSYETLTILDSSFSQSSSSITLVSSTGVARIARNSFQRFTLTQQPLLSFEGVRIQL